MEEWEDLITFLKDAQLEHLIDPMIGEGVTLDLLLIANDQELSILVPKITDKIRLRMALQKRQLANKNESENSNSVALLQRQSVILAHDTQELDQVTLQPVVIPVNDNTDTLNPHESDVIIQELQSTKLPTASTPKRLFSPELGTVTLKFNSQTANNSVLSDWNEQFDEELDFLTTFELKSLGKDTGRCLRKLLSSVTAGRLLLEKAKTEEELNSNDRSCIVKLIVECELKALKEISSTIRKDIWQQWANEVVQLFKKETKEIYYVPYHVIGGKVVQASGLFHNRLITHRRLLSSGCKKRKNSTSSESSNSSSTSSNKYPKAGSKRVRPLPELFKACSPDDNTPETTSSAKDSLDWLRASSSPTELVTEKWLQTFNLRNNLLAEGLSYKKYFESFPALNLPDGHNLLSLDFQTVYPNDTRIFEERFPSVKTKLLHLLVEKGSSARPDKTVLELLDLASVGEEQASLASFLGIISLLRQMPTISVPKKKVWKLSREEVRDSFIGRVATASDIEKYCTDREKLVALRGIPEQPYIVAIGSSWATVTQYEVIIHSGVRYTLPNICSAITKAYQIYWALDSAYPKDSAVCWMFIQRKIFDRKSKYDTEGVPLRELLHEINI